MDNDSQTLRDSQIPWIRLPEGMGTSPEESKGTEASTEESRKTDTWELWLYDKTRAESVKMEVEEGAPGCCPLGEIDCVDKLEDVLLHNSISSISGIVGRGYHFVRFGVHPIRALDAIGEVGNAYYMSLTYSCPSEKINTFWRTLVKHFFEETEGWSMCLPYVRGVEVEYRPDSIYKLTIWTSSLDERIGKNISLLTRGLFAAHEIPLCFDGWHSA